MFWIAAILIVVFVLVLPGVAGLEAPFGDPTLEVVEFGSREELLRELEEARANADSDAEEAIRNRLTELSSTSDVPIADLIESDVEQLREDEEEIDAEAQDVRDAGLSPDIAREIRFQKQCFLAFNMLDILSKIREIPGRNTITVPQYHTVLVGDAAPADITSLIVSRPDIHELLNAKPFLLSYFMPQVRLYKVFGNPRDEDSTQEIEFVFSDHVTEDRVQDIFTNKAGRGDGVGLLSFNWEFLGVNPAEVENNIKASLNLHFNNMRDFEEERTDPSGLKYRFSDLIIAEPLYQVNASDPSFPAIQSAFNPNFFRLKVVAGWTLPRASGEARELFEDNGVNFEELVDLVKLNKKVLYLNLISHDLSFNDDGTLDLTVDYQAMIEGIFSSPQSDILSIEASESTTKVEARIEVVENQIRRLQNLNRQTPGEIASRTVDLSELSIPQGETYDAEEQLRRATDYRDSLLGARNLLQQRDRDRSYSGILNQLVASDRIYVLTVTSQNLGFSNLDGFENEQLSLSQLDEDVRNRYIAAYNAQNEEEGEIPEEIDPNILARVDGNTVLDTDRSVQDARLMRRMIAQSRMISTNNFIVETGFTVNTTVQPNNPCTDGTPLGDLLTQRVNSLQFSPQFANPISDSGVSTDFTDEQYRQALNNLRSFVELGPANRDSIPLRFMLFGDILDVVVGNAAQWLKESNVGIYLGPFAYNNPTKYLHLEGEKPKPIYIPLAYIPISVELFSMWFFTEIIEKGRTLMTIRQFIRSVFNKLVINAFGGECVFDPSGRFSLTQENFSIAPEFYSIPKIRLKNVGIHDIGGGGLPGGVGTYETMEEAIRESGERLLDYEPGATFDDYAQVVLYQARSDDQGAGQIYGTDMATDGYLQVAERDIERGLYHLNLGSDRGLVKSISFDRIDQDYLLEARISAAGELGSFGQLRQRYNATVTLYGNMFFYPGQYIYINPSMVGVRDEQGAHSAIPSVSALTTKLGIGGYFLITKVENIIEPGLFETILKCNWVYSGFRVETERGESVSDTIDFYFRDPDPEPTPLVREEPGANEGVTRIIYTDEETGEETVRIRVNRAARTETWDTLP
tara:strand:- start:1688 stop:4945 length:3258 start_codon:yes stop_codon:yes gene_type:complete